jgi:hypothetical protein
VDEPEPEPGELICDQCGKGNRAEANFCRRCGASLAEARVAERPPWWRRIFVRPGKTYAAGERRRGSKATAKTGVAKARRGIFQVSRALAILAILGIVSIGAWRGDLTGRVNDWYHSARVAVFPHYDRVGPAKVRASSALGVHRVGRAFDRSFATYWQAAPEVAKGQSLTAYFDPKVDIARIGITLGNKDKPNPALVVPHRVRVRLFANGRRVASKVLFLKNTPDFQRFSIDGNGVTKAVIRIQSAFPNRQVRHHHVTLTEVEYFEEN